MNEMGICTPDMVAEEKNSRNEERAEARQLLLAKQPRAPLNEIVVTVVAWKQSMHSALFSRRAMHAFIVFVDA